MTDKKKALIAMSGGVDSSVAAWIIKERGLECVGGTMKLYKKEEFLPQETVVEDGAEQAAEAEAGSAKAPAACGSADDVEDARKICEALGMPHYLFDMSESFRRNVIDRFVATYQKGMTPNPCIVCNRYMKFGELFEEAKKLGCDYVVTGHYVRIREENGEYKLLKALDESKDQSYVLYSLTQDQLAHAMFPLGEMDKTQARAIADERGFINANKPDSQDICFVPDGDYASVIEKLTGISQQPGDFVDLEGNVLGRHKGIIHYTIGQRRGLGLALKASMYVCRIDVKNNRVVLGYNEYLFSKDVYVEDFNWISGKAPEEPIRCKAKIRYRQKEQWATAAPSGDRGVRIVFDEPQRAVTPGQSAVLYDGEVVLGGGEIVGSVSGTE